MQVKFLHSSNSYNIMHIVADIYRLFLISQLIITWYEINLFLLFIMNNLIWDHWDIIKWTGLVLQLIKPVKIIHIILSQFLCVVILFASDLDFLGI